MYKATVLFLLFALSNVKCDDIYDIYYGDTIYEADPPKPTNLQADEGEIPQPIPDDDIPLPDSDIPLPLPGYQENGSCDMMPVCKGDLQWIEEWQNGKQECQKHGSCKYLVDSVEISEFLKNKMPRLEVSHPNFHVIKSRALTSFNKLIVLVFDFGVIERIERNAFGRLVKLKELQITQNMLNDIDSHAFDRLSNLQVLSLTDNNISSFQPLTFLPLKNLKHLHLESNSLKDLADNMFFGLKNLRTLNLANNSISGISDDAFSDLNQLEELNLRGNKITSISPAVFKPIATLKILVLTKNPLKSFKKSLFLPLQLNLRNLILDNCDLVELPRRVFSGFNLTRLSLLGNQLERLPNLGRVPLKVLNLKGNPLKCDCNVTEFLIWVRRMRTLEDVPVCRFPERRKGKTLTSFTKDQMCSEEVTTAEMTTEAETEKTTIAKTTQKLETTELTTTFDYYNEDTTNIEATPYTEAIKPKQEYSSTINSRKPTVKENEPEIKIKTNRSGKSASFRRNTFIVVLTFSGLIMAGLILLFVCKCRKMRKEEEEGGMEMMDPPKKKGKYHTSPR